MATQCLDDPSTILQQSVCLAAVSKDLKGKFSTPHAQVHQCQQPLCKTMKITQSLKFDVPGAGSHCDSPLAHQLGGTLVIDRLVTACDQDGTHRGFHAGDFVWTGVGGVKATGRISGMTNEGTHRLPHFADCQKCDTRGVMEGRLCGEITAPNSPALNGAHVVAAYRIKFEPTANGPNGDTQATLEGVIISSCHP
jgi:hypothetical protein